MLYQQISGLDWRLNTPIDCLIGHFFPQKNIDLLKS